MLLHVYKYDKTEQTFSYSAEVKHIEFRSNEKLNKQICIQLVGLNASYNVKKLHIKTNDFNLPLILFKYDKRYSKTFAPIVKF